MLLTEKYKKEFLETQDIGKNKRKSIETIIKVEKETGIEMLKWNDSEIELFLERMQSISPLAATTCAVTLRKFSNLICNKEEIDIRNYNVASGVFDKHIDKEKLLSVIINHNQYISIKNQLDIGEQGYKINVRDKVIFELAWSGLTNDEIRMIKEEDIEYIKTDNKLEIAIISIDDRIIRVEDPEVTEDIKNCIKELYCVRTAKDGRIKKTFYKDSEYLVKPINVGRYSDKTYLENPHLALQRVFRSGEVVCNEIDIEKLTLADIRRSKIIYLLSPKNESGLNIDDVRIMFSLKTKKTLYWLRRIAAEIYKKDILEDLYKTGHISKQEFKRDIEALNIGM